MWQLFEADSANDLWIKVVETLRQNAGVHIQPSRGGATREILHAALTLRQPRERWVTARRPAMNPAFAIAEVFWILGGRQDAKFLSYFNRSLTRHAGDAPCLHGAYGYRLRRHFQIDQLERAYESLRANPFSRQVVLQIWDAGTDLPQSDGTPRDSDIPCNTQSILKVRDGKLEWLQIMRSNDVFLGLPHNLIQFTMLQEVMAGWLGIEPGQYHHISDSLHVYDYDLATMQPDAVVDSAPADVFSLPKSESADAIAKLVEVVEQIIDERHPAEEIVRLANTIALPESYRNALSVMVAEGLRRRKELSMADAMMHECTSATFSRMWLDWRERLRQSLK